MKYFSQILTFIFLLVFSVHFAAQEALKIGSYNIRYDNQGDRDAGNAWENRLPVISSIIRWEEPDIFGAQEVLVHQLKGLQGELPAYGVYGVGRDDGKEAGEYAPIFYKTDKFLLKKSGQFWLSETPEKPSIGWDAALPRICTWVVLEEKATQKEIWFFNLHMDHIGVEARRQSAKLVLEKVKAMAGDQLFFLTGDFNVDQHNEIYDILADSGYMEDSFTTALDKMAWNGTFNAFDTHLWTDSRIDHIFLPKGTLVTNYAVLTETYRSKNAETKEIQKGDFPKEVSFHEYEVRLPSDHFPIVIRVKVPTG